MLFKHNLMRVDQGWLLGLVCLLGAFLVWGVVQISSSTAPLQYIGQGVAYLADENAEYDVHTVRQFPESVWQLEPSEQLSFGMADYPYWFKFELPTVSEGKQRLLEVDYALLDKIDVWFIAGQRILSEQHEGDSYPFSRRQIAHEKLLFEVPSSAQPLTVILKVQSAGTIRVPLRLWEKDTFLVFNGEHTVVLGLFFGFMTAMALSNLFFFLTTKSPTFLSYCGYVICLALTLATLHGLGFKYLWPENTWLQARSVGIFASATIFFALVFSAQLLNVKSHSRVLFSMLSAAAAAFLLAIGLSLVIPYAYFIKLFLVMMSLAILVIYGVGLVLWNRGVRLARFYTVAWTALLVSGFIASLDNADLITLDTPSHYLLMFGATVETFLLALALALSYSQQRQELFETQELALVKERMARQAQEEMLKVKEEAQEDLEYKVQERTLELEIALRELSETNRELEQKNTTDALTNIRNRHYFDKKYLAEVRRSRREQTELTVAMIDVDHFKNINDNYGHMAGDECIRFVANVLKENLKRPSDDACRYGGEEFALILPNTGQSGAEQVVEAMRKQVESNEVNTSAGKIHMTISAGLCTAVIQSMEDEKRLLEFADQALYRAKSQGRNQVVTTLVSLETAVNQE